MSVRASNPVALTPTNAHHFFGYYSICPWSADGTRFICLESSFHDHPPEAGETATVGYVDTRTGEWAALSETLAWNLQQGTMLHWLPTRPNTHIVHNDLEGTCLVARLINVVSGQRERTYERPIAAMSHRGDVACNLNYARMFRRRRVVGYAGADDPTEGVLHPEDDGLFLMDTESGASRLIVSMATIMEDFEHPEEMGRSPIWFNHVGFSPDDSRIFFLARYCVGGHGGPLNSAMFTVNQDGSDLRKVVEYGQGMSHFEWKNDHEIVVTVEWEKLGRAFVIFTDGEDDHRLLDARLVEDGHMTYSPDRRWLLSDIGPRSHPESMSTLRLWDSETAELHMLGEYHNPEPFRGDIRCDLHPRWNHAGDEISWDSIHEGTRQVYAMKLDLT